MKCVTLQRKKGLTFIEILIGLAILAIGTLGIISLFPVGMDAQNKSEQYSLASNLANKWVAMYQTLGWRNRYTLGGYSSWRTDPEFAGLEFQTAFLNGIDSTDSSDLLKIKVRYNNRGKATELAFGAYYIQSYD